MLIHNDLENLVKRAYSERINALLGYDDAPTAIDQIAHYLQDVDEAIRERAVDALLDIGSSRALDLVRNYLASHPVEEPTVLKTSYCPTLPRLYHLVLNPASATPLEKMHWLSGCQYCSKGVERYESKIIHPNWSQLIGWRLGLLKGQVAQTVERHMTQDECLQCRNKLRLLKVQKVIEEFSQKAGLLPEKTLTSIEELMESTITAAFNMLFRSAVNSGAYADTSPPRLYIKFADATETLRVSLRENSSQTRRAKVGDLLAEVYAAEKYAGYTVQIELIGNQIESATIELLAQEHQSLGTYNFGPLLNISKRLGEIVTVVAELVHDA